MKRNKWATQFENQMLADRLTNTIFKFFLLNQKPLQFSTALEFVRERNLVPQGISEGRFTAMLVQHNRGNNPWVATQPTNH